MLDPTPVKVQQVFIPRVSVIIPTFNSEATIVRALESVIGQTFQKFEILVCDDASTDSTAEIVTEFLKKDSRIRLLSLPVNQGAGAARNIGIKAALGEYLAFLDGDDEWRPEKLAFQIKRMDRECASVGVCFCGATIIKDGEKDTRIKYIPSDRWESDTFRQFVSGDIYFYTPTIMIRKVCLNISGMMVPEMRRNQDGEFLLRIFRDYNLAVIVDDLVIVHLVTKPGFKKIYIWTKSAYPFWARHVSVVRRKCGYLTSVKFIGSVKTTLVTTAIRERLWHEAWKDLLARLVIAPWLYPDEINQIMRAVYRVLATRN